MYTTKSNQPGVYQRPLGGAEAMMAGVVGVDAPLPREPLQIHCYADFTASEPPEKVLEAFKTAWKALRLLKSPDVATTLQNGIKSYTVPSDAELQTWLDKTFVIASAGTSVDSAIREMHQRPDWRPVLYLIPQSKEGSTFEGSLVFFISHWRTEASGVYLMMDQLFDYAADILAHGATLKALEDHKAGSEAQRLTPALEDMMMPDKESTAESTARVEKHFQAHDDAQPTVELAHLGDFTQDAGDMHWTQHIYSSESTAGILSACRKEGLSVNASVHAAYLEALWAVAPDDNKGRGYASMMPAEIRRRLPESSAYRRNGCWNSAQMMVLVVPHGDNLIANAKSLRSQYAVSNTEEWLHEDMRATTERLMQPSANYPPKPKALPWITCFGVLENGVIQPDHSPLTIKHVGGWADNTGPGIVLTVWTFRDRLTLQITRNVAFHADEQIEEILTKMDTALSKGLGVEVVVDEVKKGEN